MHRALLILTVSGALCLLLVSGCGGSDSTAGATSSITKAEFVKQGNAICRGINEQVEDEFGAFAEENNLKKEANKVDPELVTEEIGRLAVAALKQQLAELGELPVPSGDESQVEQILEGTEESIQRVEKDPTFRTSGNPYEELNAAASRYGLAECSL